MAELKDKNELFDILKGPYPIKFLCEKYNQYKGKDYFKHFDNNGDCEDHELDLIYHGTIPHFCDGDFYSIQCCVRDPYDKEEDINPAVSFWVEFVPGSGYDKFFKHCPKLEDYWQNYSIRSVAQFLEVMDNWPAFVAHAIELVEHNRKEWEENLSPAPDTKEVYYFVKNDLRLAITHSSNDIKDFKEV